MKRACVAEDDKNLSETPRAQYRKISKSVRCLPAGSSSGWRWAQSLRGGGRSRRATRAADETARWPSPRPADGSSRVLVSCPMRSKGFFVVGERLALPLKVATTPVEEGQPFACLGPAGEQLFCTRGLPPGRRPSSATAIRAVPALVIADGCAECFRSSRTGGPKLSPPHARRHPCRLQSGPTALAGWGVQPLGTLAIRRMLCTISRRRWCWQGRLDRAPTQTELVGLLSFGATEEIWLVGSGTRGGGGH